MEIHGSHTESNFRQAIQFVQDNTVRHASLEISCVKTRKQLLIFFFLYEIYEIPVTFRKGFIVVHATAPHISLFEIDFSFTERH